MRWFRKRSPSSRAELYPILHRVFGFADAKRVAPWAMPAVGFRNGRIGREPATVGTTRFGGSPDMPDSVPWPCGPDGPLAFLGQVALAEAAPLDVDRVLPSGGVLSFFYNIREYAWGNEAADREKFAVLFHPAATLLRRRAFPDNIREENRVARARRVSPFLWWQLPKVDPLAREAIGFGDNPTVAEPAVDLFTDKYWGLAWDLTQPHVPVGNHQLLGWANGMYHQEGADCRLTCELARNGFPAEGTPAFAAAANGRNRWRCLLQVGDDRDLYNDVWADGGTIAFFVRDDDLGRGDFGQCWCVLSA